MTQKKIDTVQKFGVSKNVLIKNMVKILICNIAIISI